MATKFLLFLGVACTGVLAKDEVVMTRTGLKMDLVGNSGQVFLTTTNGKDFKLKLDKMEEFDATGKITTNKITNFAGSTWTWTTPENVMVSGSNLTRSVLWGKTAVGGETKTSVNFTVYTSDYNVPRTTKWGTTASGLVDVVMPVGSMKFSVTVENWPFKSTSNTLRFGLELLSKGHTAGSATNRTRLETNSGKNRKFDKIAFGDAVMDGPGFALVDGVFKNITTKTDQTNNKVLVNYEFPYFSSKLEFDPVVDMGATSGAAIATASMVGFVLTLASLFL